MSITITLSRPTDITTRAIKNAGAGHPLILPLLEWLAYMAPTGFPKQVFFQFSALLPVKLAEAGRETWIRLFDELERHRLVIHSRQDLYLFGPVLSSLRRGIRARRASSIVRQAGRLLLATFPESGKPAITRDELNRLSWHARALAEHAMNVGDRETAGQLMHWLDRSGRLLIGPWPDRAINCHQSALLLSQRLLGSDNPLTIIRLNNLGETWRRLKEPLQAERCLMRALYLLERSRQRNPRLEANILGNIGLLRIDQQRLEEAHATFGMAWSLARTTRGLDDPLVFLSVNNLARIMIRRNDLDEVIDLLQKALEQHDRVNPDTPHLNVAIILNNLARVQKKLGHAAEAENTLKLARDTARHFLPKDHPLFTEDP
ncbi:MAG: tetratricopeptide repeat protein [Magnetococcales bacterium]|nr:tetratricopeptide repeat protein [Magnetococcales bacterium]